MFSDLDAETIFTEFNKIPEDIIFDEGITHTYEITIQAKGLKDRTIKGNYYMEELPIDYAKFIGKVSRLINEFSTWGDVFDPSIYAKSSRRESDYILFG